MKRLQIVVCVFAIALLFCTDAMAQRGGGGGMRGMMRMMGGGFQLDSQLLAMEEVQKELELSDEEIEKISEKADEINQSFRQESREILTDGGEMSEVEALFKELREEEKEIVAALSDKQKSRLSQLRYQRMGTGMFQDKQAQAELGLSDDQKREVAEAVEANAKELETAMEEAREAGDFGAIREAMGDLRKQLEEKLTGILNEEQTSKVEELKGKEFKFPERQRGGGGRGRSDF